MRSAVVGLLALLAVLVGGPAAPASAHTGLESTAPADGARLTRVPPSVVLTFSGDVVSDARAAVIDPNGSRTVPTKVDGRRVTLPVRDAGPGTYRVQFRVVARDGHPVSGALTFTVAAGANSPTPTGTQPASTLPAPTDTEGGASPSGAAGTGAGPGAGTGLSAPAGAESDDGLPPLALAWLAIAALALGGAAVALAVRRRGD